MEKEKRQQLCTELSSLRLTKAQRDEFDLIAKHQPVFAGNILSKQGSQELIDLGLVMLYEGKYVLTEKGTVLKENLVAAGKIRDSGILYKK